MDATMGALVLSVRFGTDKVKDKCYLKCGLLKKMHVNSPVIEDKGALYTIVLYRLRIRGTTHSVKGWDEECLLLVEYSTQVSINFFEYCTVYSTRVASIEYSSEYGVHD